MAHTHQMTCGQDQYMMAADEINRTPFTVFGEQHSWTGSAHALGSRHIQRVVLVGPRSSGIRERLDGRQAAAADTAHGEKRRHIGLAVKVSLSTWRCRPSEMRTNERGGVALVWHPAPISYRSPGRAPHLYSKHIYLYIALYAVCYRRLDALSIGKRRRLSQSSALHASALLLSVP